MIWTSENVVLAEAGMTVFFEIGWRFEGSLRGMQHIWVQRAWVGTKTLTSC